MSDIVDFAPEGTESGVGLALQDEKGNYLFCLAGTRHGCPPGELFYAGIGGHREEGEDWLTCAHREAMEEIRTDIDVLSAATTWYVPRQGPIQQVQINDQPRPFAIYDMVHPHGIKKAGNVYHIVIFNARLNGKLTNLPLEELQGIIALTPEQVIQGKDIKRTLADLLNHGAYLLEGGVQLDLHTQLYPIGTANALGNILSVVHKS